MIEIGGRRLNVVALDFETFYDTDYSLTKLSTTSYVRDKRFLVQMVGIKVGDEPVRVYSQPLAIKVALASIDWANSALVCHNTAFDGLILKERYKVTPAFFLDTLSMARGALGHHMRHDLDTVGKALGVGGKVKPDSLKKAKGQRVLPEALLADMEDYCRFDVERCRQVFDALYGFIPDDELELIDITLRMFCEPQLRLDRALATEELEEEIAGKVRALVHAGSDKETLLSNEKFAQRLAALGVQPPKKMSTATGKATWAFAKSDLGLMALKNDSNPQVRALVEARLKVKSTIGETRAQRFLETGERGKRIPVMLKYYGAHTGRWAGGDKMNMQNLPRQEALPDGTPDPASGRLRRALLAPRGQVLVVADSAQIEARVNAWAAGQRDMLDVFRAYDAGTGPDAYKVMASKLFGVPLEEVTKAQRFYGKMAVLGLGYGMGAAKFFDTLMKLGRDVKYEEVLGWVDTYRRVNHRIPAYWRTLQEHCRWMMLRTSDVPLGPLTFIHEAIRLPNGMFLRYPQLRGNEQEITFAGRNGARNKLYGGVMCENVVQALARIVVADQMLTVKRAGYRPVMMTHDEIVVLAPTRQGDKCLQLMLDTMRTPPAWAPDLPLAADGGFASNYSK